MSASETPSAPVTPANGLAAEDPGKTLGIVGFVLAFLLSVVGIIVSAIALKKSKEAGFSNGLAKAGIIVGIVVTILYVVVTIMLIAASAALVNSGVTTM
ncbi:DUF4190 domain-containing protein [Antribacter gilvus]|uniref:DUF4190 domain-containing protein n=1 Tax=Antribacter gilvus TaxID=2304675 RepID=UPI000F7893FE|nr:DUF4190 domain-containing protein [Antribacter gilvus]